MSLILDASGTTSALTIGTETTLASSTNNGVFFPFVDLSNLQNGDVLEIRQYLINLAGGAYKEVWGGGSGPTLPINPLLWLPVLASDLGFRVTLKQIAGTGRTFDWKYLRS